MATDGALEGSWLATAVNVQGIRDASAKMVATMLKDLKVVGTVDSFVVAESSPSATCWLSEPDEDDGDWRDHWLPTWEVRVAFKKKPKWPKPSFVPVGTSAFDTTWGNDGLDDLEGLVPKSFDLYAAASSEKAAAKLESDLTKVLTTKAFKPLVRPAWNGPRGTSLWLGRVPISSKKMVDAAAGLVRKARAELEECGAATHWRSASEGSSKTSSRHDRAVLLFSFEEWPGFERLMKKHPQLVGRPVAFYSDDARVKLMASIPEGRFPKAAAKAAMEALDELVVPLADAMPFLFDGEAEFCFHATASLDEVRRHFRAKGYVPLSAREAWKKLHG